MIDYYKIYKQSVNIRKRLGESDSSPIDVFALAQDINDLTLVLYPLGDNISGMCVRTERATVIAINSAMSIGRQNFSLAHELYHYYFDTTPQTVICRKEIGSRGNEVEMAADRFASYLLMPLGNEVLKEGEKITFEKIIALEQYYKVSNQAMLYRLVEEGVLSLKEAEGYKKGIIRKAESLGYDTSLYRPSRSDKTCKTFGNYIKQTQRLMDKELISNGKYEQLLLEAFRADLVYGPDNEEEELYD